MRRRGTATGPTATPTTTEPKVKTSRIPNSHVVLRRADDTKLVVGSVKTVDDRQERIGDAGGGHVTPRDTVDAAVHDRI